MFDAGGASVDRPVVQVSASSAMVEKGEYRHFMEKEIHEQPDSVQHTLSEYLDLVTGKARTGTIDFTAIDRIQIIACGTAFYAGQIGKYAFERYAGLPCDIEIASEFRYREPPLSPQSWAIFVSQSGETADTLAALRNAAEIEAMPGVTDVVAGLADGRPEIRCHADASAIPAVVRRLHEGGVRSLTMTPPSLDDLFLQQYREDTEEVRS